VNIILGKKLIRRSRLIILFSLIIGSALLGFANFKYPDAYLEKGFYTCLALTVIYFFFEVLFEELVTKRIKESKTRYSLRKVISILSLATFALAFVSIWIVEAQNILIAFGLVGAGVAIAIQDVFKNFIGGIMIVVNGIYRVGDRIEINQKFGDVIDIGLLYTTLMETREWVAGDQVTGRLTIVPNGAVLAGTIQNYTRDFDFIWDEISIPITYDSDWNEANTKILDIVKMETKQITENAEKRIVEMEGKYYFTKRSLEPAIFLTLTDNWITFDVRYITEVRQRRALHDKLSRMILAEIEKSEKIKIASATLNITEFPPVKLLHKEQEK
jgi:small-conductance mechanosensitive channel